MTKKYTVSQEQFEQLEHFKRMFETNSEEIRQLCSSEKDDIVYGFELGRMHFHLRDCYIEMTELLSNIKIKNK